MLVIPASPPSPLHHHTTCSVMLCRLCSISCSHALTQPVFWRLARRMSSSGRARRWLTCTTYYPSTLFLRGSPTHLASHCRQCIRCEPKLHGPSTCRLRVAWRNAKVTALRITVAACLLTIGSRRDTSKAARSLAAALRRAACPSRRATILRSPSGQLPGFTPNEHLKVGSWLTIKESTYKSIYFSGPVFYALSDGLKDPSPFLYL